MKIVVNARYLRKGRMDGIGWFMYNTLKIIVLEHPEIEFHFLFDSGIEKEFVFAPNVIPHNLFPPAKHALLNVMWFEWSVAQFLKKEKADLFLSLDGNLCLRWDGPQYAVIHDLNFEHMPEVLKYSNRIYYRHFFPKYAHKAARIGTVSEFSKQDIVSTYSIDSDKIDVVYNGINDFFHPLTEAVKNETRKQYTAGKNYFVFVGTISPRKNIEILMQAFDLAKQNGLTDQKLVIAGRMMYKGDSLMQLKDSLKHGNDILFTGSLSNEELEKVLGSTLGLVFVPIFEGFGIPLIEAMQADIPVISANVTSLPEIAGDAALMVDPHDTNAIANAMTQMATDQMLRQDLIEKGRVRKTQFSWTKTAHLLWASIEKVIS